MRRLTLDALSDDLRERVRSALAPGEKLDDLSYAEEDGQILVYIELPGGGLAVLGCSECLGREDPPSIPFSAITSDDTRYTPLAKQRLCASCHSFIRDPR